MTGAPPPTTMSWSKGTDPAQLAFELGVILAGTDIVSVLHDDDHAITRARTAVRQRLAER